MGMIIEIIECHNSYDQITGSVRLHTFLFLDENCTRSRLLHCKAMEDILKAYVRAYDERHVELTKDAEEDELTNKALYFMIWLKEAVSCFWLVTDVLTLLGTQQSMVHIQCSKLMSIRSCTKNLYSQMKWAPAMQWKKMFMVHVISCKKRAHCQHNCD